eukprot:CAMPEP_0197439552 /NCGR_PEP_ID=MMETSP1175-20131217/6257_1 /TAXON_ID=1003142 /ORGANISM="Triceratium dubium, Strain CCMP147" /LENGTH=80 /DNA_ID=CAMNT_0042969479 /DNA_START=34 /DNA_END=276 /DNA_ORIENTATION=+
MGSVQELPSCPALRPHRKRSTNLRRRQLLSRATSEGRRANLRGVGLCAVYQNCVMPPKSVTQKSEAENVWARDPRFCVNA